VVQEAAAVEDDLLDAGGLGALGDELADLRAASTLPVEPPLRSASCVDAAASVRPASSSMTCDDVLVGPEHGETGTLGGAADLLADPAVAPDAELALVLSSGSS
jgi:hypothetical protein